jgi:AAA family ATP:ADP antiporter
VIPSPSNSLRMSAASLSMRAMPAHPKAQKPDVLAPAIVLFLVMVAHSILETARDALFLTRLGPDRLGWAYVAIAVIALGAVMVVRRFRGVREARGMLLVFLMIATAGTTILAFALTRSAWAAFVLYVWTGTIATLVVPAFWLVIERDVRIGDAKRILGAIAAGGTLGALTGSAIASLLGQLVDARHLVDAGAIAFGLAALSVQLLPAVRRPVAEHAHAEPERLTADHEPRSRRYAQLLILLAVVSTVTLTIGDLMFKRLIVERMPADELATVFGATYTGLNVVALAVQLVVTPRLLDRVGVGSALAVLPILVLATTLGFVLTGAAVAVFALKLADGGLRNSVHRVVSEILFVPMRSLEREKARPLVEVFGQRGGQALAAGIVLAIASDANATWSLAVATTATVVLWLVVVATMRRAYVRRFRDKLDAAGIHREARLPMLDGASIELLVETLASPDEREALAALDLLAQRGERIPALVLYHPSDAVVRHALALLEGDLRPDVSRVLQQLMLHDDPQIRAAALAASSRTGLHYDQLVTALTDDEADVRAAAVVGLSLIRPTKRGAPRDVERELAALRDGSVDERVALAHAIARQPDDRFRALLLQLASRREPRVIREVLRAWQLAPQLADVERLLRFLEDPHVRGDARRVFIAGGELYLARLLDALDDPRTSLGVRRHLPRTISRFQSPEAAAALVARLPREPDGATQFKILRALGRMRADTPNLAIDEAPIRAYARRSIEDASRYASLSASVGLHRTRSTPGLDLLRELLDEKRLHAIERVFRALGILYPLDDLQSVHDAFVGNHEEHRGAAREILEHLVSMDLRTPLIQLLSGKIDLDALREEYPAHTDVLAALLADPSDSLRCVTAHHVAELQLVELRDELVRLKPVTESTLVTNAFEQAIARLHG